MEAQSQGVAVENPASFSTTIIVNLARDQRRGAYSAQPAFPLVDTESCLASARPTPDQEICAREGLERALRALERVPGRQRRALLLRALGNDYAGIAEEMGTSEQNARKLVQVARAAMQARA
jgi:RNA polymerase sigma-70 factor (ECF subfamily)